MPTYVKLNTEYETEFINFRQVESLHLKQGTCQDNLKKLGERLLSLKDIHIEHFGDPDYPLFKITKHLPERVVLNNVIHHCRNQTQINEDYSTSAILRQWEPERCKKTEVLLHANIAYDFKVEVEAGSNTIRSTKSPND